MDKDKSKGEIIIYTSDDGKISLDTKLENNTIWLTQKDMAELFGVKTPAISKHLKNIFNEGELDRDSVCRKFRHTASDGKNYSVNYYNLDAVISVGYRANSVRATEFRRWCTNVHETVLSESAEQDSLCRPWSYSC